jgi:hypothetical protein
MDIIQCGLASIWHSDGNPGVWLSSFVSVILQPMRQIPFAEWCKKLEPFMQAADSFNLITESKQVYEYMLLPSLWQAMHQLIRRQ